MEQIIFQRLYGNGMHSHDYPPVSAVARYEKGAAPLTISSIIHFHYMKERKACQCEAVFLVRGKIKIFRGALKKCF